MPQEQPRIIFEDTHIIVLNKPAGMLSQSDISGDESLVDWLRKYVGRNYVGLVHRLDRNTSGLMVVAKRSKAATRLTDALQNGDLERTYIAVVEGNPPNEKDLEHYLIKNEKTNEVRVVKDSKNAKIAKLHFDCFCHTKFQNKDIAALHLKLETGRGHQIRVQCAFEGYPLLGDKKYGSLISHPGRPALHSYSMKFAHPMGGEPLSFKDPLPSELLALLPKGVVLP